MNHIFEVQLTVPSFNPQQKSFLKSLGKRFEKSHNRKARKNNTEGYMMSPYIEWLDTRFLSKRVCKMIGQDRKIYMVFRLYHESISEQNMAVRQLKKEMSMWREDLPMPVGPVKSYKELYFANSQMSLYCKLAKWIHDYVGAHKEKEGLEITTRGSIIYSI
jgi:hypothetical protein